MLGSSVQSCDAGVPGPGETARKRYNQYDRHRVFFIFFFLLTTSAGIEVVNPQTLPTFRSGPAPLITSATSQVPRLGTEFEFELSLQSDRLGYGRHHRAGEHRGDDESFVAPASIGSSLRGTTIGRQFDVD